MPDAVEKALRGPERKKKVQKTEEGKLQRREAYEDPQDKREKSTKPRILRSGAGADIV